MKDPAEQEKRVASATASEKAKRGGRRPGAGRKPSYLRKSALPPMTAHLILARYDVVELWGSVLQSKSDDVRLRALEYLTDRIFGRPNQPSTVTGAMQFEHLNHEAIKARIDELQKELGLVEAPSATNKGILPPSKSFAGPEGPSSVVIPTAPEPLPPRPPLVMHECTRHGSYQKPAKGDACPYCVQEAGEAERKLLGLLPGGWA